MSAVVSARLPLFSIEAEMSVLGSMILSARAAEEIVTILNEEDFYRPGHQLIFRAIKQLIGHHREVDLVTLRTELTERKVLAEIGGVEYLTQILEYVPSAGSARHYADIVLDKSTMRRLELAGRNIVDIVHDAELESTAERVDRAEQEVFEVGRKQLGKYFRHVSGLAKEFFMDVDTIIETGKPMFGVPTGFPDLDRLTTGFYPGDLVIIGARPAMGKSSLVFDFALNVARGLKGRKPGTVAVFSLEMSSIQVVRRMVSMICGTSMGVLKSERPMTNQQYQSLAEGCDTLYNLPIYIDDASDLTPMEMRGKCRRLKAEHGLDLVIVDYLQLMRGSRRTENRVQEISEIARSLKAMAKELEIPVIALSQLSRAVESRDDKRPQLSDIRESGSIEAEADLVMLLYRDSYYKAKEERRPEVENPEDVEEAEVIVAKHRNGPVGKVVLGFQPAFARYRNLERSAGYIAPED